jgi:excisionase family DNA binding protein
MPHSLKDFLTVSEAARLLGVSASTLRNWDRMGKVRAGRHPVNGYRLYARGDLERLLNPIVPDGEPSCGPDRGSVFLRCKR